VQTGKGTKRARRAGRKPAGRRIGPCRAAFAFAAPLTLAAAPVAAAAPGGHLISLCTAEGPRLILLEGPDPAAPDRDRHGQAQTGCAHALCPRELLPSGKARGRA
jgi:hypothetical protein